jgi:DNA-binding response OmpR family regulator
VTLRTGPCLDRAVSIIIIPIEHKILVIEDEVDLANLIRTALAKHGHRVYHAPSADAAFEAYRKSRLDLILLDLTLPGMNGLELLRIIRSESQVPVVLMSGRLTAANRAIGLKLGAFDYLHKPFTLAALQACVTKALRPAAH